MIVLYFISFFLVFDVMKPAYSDDEDSYNFKAVAHGPRPRLLFCGSYMHNETYSGDEWPFYVYAPLCTMWRWWMGYAPPAVWRNQVNK